MNDVNVGEVIAHGVFFDPKNFRALSDMDPNAIYQAVPQLFDLLDQRNLDFVLVGGIAMLVYVDGRNTQDIDLIVAPEVLEQVEELKVQERRGEFVRATFGELQVDLLLTSNKLFEIVRQDYSQPRSVADREMPCATVEGLILLKLFALPSLYRQGQFDRVEIYERDITMLFRDFQPQLEPLLAELSQHVLPSDLAEIREILVEIEQRIAKTKSRFSGDSPDPKKPPPTTNNND